MNFDKKTAVVLFNLGGPDSLNSVERFLFNLFSDKAIINIIQPFRFLLAKLISKRRAKIARESYALMGGKSPLLEITLAQAHSLERELSYVGNFKVWVAMRYFEPRAKEVMKKIAEYNPQKIILLPLYPQFSSATTASSIKEFKNLLPQKLKNIPIKTICCYPVESQFIKAHADLILKTIEKEINNNLDDFRFLFSAHGLPQKLIDQGDPYVFQVTKTVENIVKYMGGAIDFQICYQSKVGPLEWTKPSLDHEIRRAALDKKNAIIIPVAFVSDHVETLVELDIEYKKLAADLGIVKFLRVPALNIDGNFIKSLTEICKNANSDNEHETFCGKDLKRICPSNFKFCPNAN